MPAEPLVTVALPVYNGAASVGDVARSVLGQDYTNLELLISDNASTDGTETVCRELVRGDRRVRYHRQDRNIGVVNNFEWTKHNCRGDYLRWIGDSDDLRANYVSRCVEIFTADPRLVLVTTGLEYVTDDGVTQSTPYDASAMRSEDVLVRLREMLSLLTRNYQLLDPLYGMARVDVVTHIVHDQMLRGDEVYAIKLALAGRWGHTGEILGRRNWRQSRPIELTTLLGVPTWKRHVRDLLEVRRMIECVDEADLTASDDRRAKAAVLRFYTRRHAATFTRRARKLREKLGGSVAPS